MSTMPIALAGIGQIARDAHLPALEASPDWHLAATISRNAGVDGVKGFADIDAFLADPGEIRTISLALPPGPRFDYALKAMAAGLNVMLEKPPAVTLTECAKLSAAAEEAGVVLYASWHSRMGAAVRQAADRIAGRRLTRLHVDWREDVRQFHPGQDWVWDAGNLGVYDPGINAFSILVKLLDRPAHIKTAHMVIPEGRETPIFATMELGHADGGALSACFDWGHTGDPVWNIEIETEDGAFTLVRSGTGIDEGAGEIAIDGDTSEYPLVYARLADLVRTHRSEVDLRPMQLCADAFLLATRETGPAFSW